MTPDFADFYRDAKDDCLRTVVISTGDRELAQDLVAEAFARACASWRKVARHPNPRAWVVRTALNVRTDRWRTRRREMPLVQQADAGTHDPDPADPVIIAAVRRLPERQRQIVALRLFLDLDTETTAETLGISPGTVSSPATGQAQNTAQLTAWTVTKHPGGVIDVTIRELKDPAGLQARLRADGVPINVSFSGPNPACVPYYPNYRYIPPMPVRYLGKAPKYPWIHSYDNGSVTVSVTSPADLTLVLRPARMPRGTAFQIIAKPAWGVYAWGLVKTSPACTG